MVDGTTGVGVTGTAVETILAVNQANEVLQTVQIILACVTFVITAAYTIWQWYRKAKSKDSDGGEKITPDEVDDLIDDLKENTKHGNRN